MCKRTRLTAFLILSLLGIFLPISAARAVTCAPAGQFTYDDTNTNNPGTYVNYTGAWLTSGGPFANAMWNTIHYTTDTTATVNFCFTGSTITLFYSMASSRGQESVYIDGSLRSSFSSYAPEIRRQIGKTWDGLGYGTHTIEVRANGGGGGVTDIDSFAVDITTYSYNTYDNPNTAIRYTGSLWINGLLPGAGRGTVSSSHVLANSRG
jgi:hypothetical protein